ncbi:hypothetical protein EIP91_001742 [Steccherinum ochraceum]|uniref:MYND-type domain-containing protein n=1 Tax=Steccherinum ochraceum TaxID=92696 RepID=A0A4R0RH65_9APHY|nr:hypothetical protein EIP91_001742 [Steccherinum ochraceum]
MAQQSSDNGDAVSETRLDRFVLNGRTGDLSTVPWKEVVSSEPATASGWIKELYRNERPEIYPFLLALRPSLTPYCMSPSRWAIHRDADLTDIVMDILLEPGIFSSHQGTYKNAQLGSLLLSILECCLTYIEHMVLKDEDFELDGHHSSQCIGNVYANTGRLCDALWDSRHLASKKTDLQTDTLKDFAGTAINCVQSLFNIHENLVPGTLDFSMHAAHCLLYFWPYDESREDDVDAMLTVEYMLDNNGSRSSSAREDFIHAVLAGHENYPRDLAKKLSRLLQNEYLPIESTRRIVGFCAAFMLASHYNPLSKVQLEEGTGLVYGLVVACQRLMCSDSVHHIRQALEDIVHALFHMDRSNFVDQLELCLGELNFVMIISEAIVAMLRGADYYPQGLNFAFCLLGPALVYACRIQDESPPRLFRETVIYQSTASIWHDKMRTLRMIQTQNDAHAADKAQAISIWQTFGWRMGFREGINVPADRVSVLSDESAYWKIPKRCFWSQCGCSFKAVHRMRVCKRCWRALYCNADCQSRDWEAGHHDICQSLEREHT